MEKGENTEILMKNERKLSEIAEENYCGFHWLLFPAIDSVYTYKIQCKDGVEKDVRKFYVILLRKKYP